MTRHRVRRANRKLLQDAMNAARAAETATKQQAATDAAQAAQRKRERATPTGPQRPLLPGQTQRAAVDWDSKTQ